MIHFELLAPLYDRVIAPPDPARLRALLDLPAEGWLLDAGCVAGAPAREIPALVYALHWAERDAQPDPALTRQLVAHDGAEQAAAITFAMPAIRVGDLLGNKPGRAGVCGVRRPARPR